MRICVCKHVYIYIHIHVQRYVYACIYTQMCVYKSGCVYIYICIYLVIYLYSLFTHIVHQAARSLGAFLWQPRPKKAPAPKAAGSVPPVGAPRRPYDFFPGLQVGVSKNQRP